MLTRIIHTCKRTFRLRYLLRCANAFLFDNVSKSYTVTPSTVLIVRMDAIGDYVLFRNFLVEIRFSEKYKRHRITLCGNELWKSIAETYDNSFVDEFIWINKRDFVTNRTYRQNILNQIADAGFETAICPNAAREFLTGDSIIKASGAAFRIGSYSTRSIDSWLISILGERSYTQLIDNRKPVFEFDKNKVFFEELLGKKIAFDLPFFDQIGVVKKDTIVIMPGAGEPARQWDISKFIQLTRTLSEQFDGEILLAGGKADKELTDFVAKNINHPSVKNIAGETNPAGLVKIIAQSKLLIAHDSGGLHIAVATRTNAIGLMTGKHYKRFGPYSHHPGNVKLIFPEEEIYYERLFEKYGPGYFENVISDINRIEVNTVLENSIELLKTDESTSHR